VVTLIFFATRLLQRANGNTSQSTTAPLQRNLNAAARLVCSETRHTTRLQYMIDLSTLLSSHWLRLQQPPVSGLSSRTALSSATNEDKFCPSHTAQNAGECELVNAVLLPNCVTRQTSTPPWKSLKRISRIPYDKTAKSYIVSILSCVFMFTVCVCDARYHRRQVRWRYHHGTDRDRETLPQNVVPRRFHQLHPTRLHHPCSVARHQRHTDDARRCLRSSSDSTAPRVVRSGL